MAILLAWVTFPAGGVYPWVWIPAACLVLVLALFVRPAIASDERVRAIDVMLLATIVATLAQLVPLPYAVLHLIDPNALPVRSALWLTQPAADTNTLRLPITIVPRDTMAAIGIFSAAALLFWTCRQICEVGGTGRIVRAIAFIGLAGSVAAIVQRATNIEKLYGFWQPLDVGARPYGPFVNRNHLATWIIMACPLVFGYLLARAPSRGMPRLFSQRVVRALTQLGTIRIWLVASVGIMTVAVLISTSRSGLTGLIAALGLSLWWSKNRRGPGVRRWTVVQVVVLAVAAALFTNYDALLRRVDQSFARSAPDRGRMAVWADTVRLIKDFPLTGTGAGTYGTAIHLYQTAEPGYAIGEAHNHYLQLAAEGGALLAIPVALASGFFLTLLRRRLEQDTTPNYLIRAGAGAGLAGVLVQSIWETGLTMPANAMLFAVAAAIATHAPSLAGAGHGTD